MPKSGVLSELRAPEPLCAVHVVTKAIRENIPPARHPHHHVSLLIRGDGFYFGGPAACPPQRPVASMLPAGDQDYCGLRGPMESWFAGFTWRGLKIKPSGTEKMILGWGGQSMAVSRWKPLDADRLGRFVETFTALRSALASTGLPAVVRARALLMELFDLFIETPECGPERLGHRALAQFHAALTRHACEGVPVEDLAAETGVSVDYVRDLFRVRYGMRPVEYRTSLRMGRARELLASSTLNVKEVAHRTGYPNALYFSRAFRSYFGMSPREMIHRYRLPH